MPVLLLAWSVLEKLGFFKTGWLALQVDVGKLNFLSFVVCFVHIICELYRFNETLQVFVADVTESAGINDANTFVRQVGAELD